MSTLKNETRVDHQKEGRATEEQIEKSTHKDPMLILTNEIAVGEKETHPRNGHESHRGRRRKRGGEGNRRGR